ncbi:MAG: DNA-formamidopyrimidine glycosylase family protein [Candidatus Methanofastidiosia archaeon]
MYELPDILVLVQQMNKELIGKTIESANFNEKGYFNLPKKDFEAALTGKAIESVEGKGKWISVKMSSDTYVQVGEHSGHVLYHADTKTVPDVYTLRVDFTDNTVLTIRNHGMSFLRVVRKDELGTFKYPGVLGISPLDAAFTVESFNEILEQNSKRILKAVLLDQSILAGLGNGYFQEVVYRAGVHPKRKAGGLSEKERRALHTAIREILTNAVKLGGKEDTTDLYGNPGRYQKVLGAHSLEKPCPVCGTSIEKMNILGSTTYVCPSCQE